jgi:hypothetical protein
MVVERGTRQPLAGVNVVILGAGKTFGASTDADGRFMMVDVPVGRHTLTATMLGMTPF